MSVADSPDITVYHVPGSRSTMVLWVLEELQLPYKAVEVDMGKDRTPEHKAAHPLGIVPAFSDGGVIVQETGAIIQYLLERYSQGKLQYPPGDWPHRGTFLQYCWHAEATLLPIVLEIVYHTKLLPQDQRIPQMVPYQESKALPRLLILNDQLQGKPFLVGDTFTAADVMIGYALSVTDKSTDLLKRSDADFKNLREYLKRVTSRPAYRRARGLDPSDLQK